MDVCKARLEAQRGRREIRHPSPVNGAAHDAPASLFVSQQMLNPQPARACVVQAQVLHIENLEACPARRSTSLRWCKLAARKRRGAVLRKQANLPCASPFEIT